MSVRTRVRRKSATFIALISSALLAGACGLDGAAGQSPTGAGTAATGQTVLKIGDPGNAGELAYAKKHGSFDAPLAEAGARIEWGGSYASFTATIDAVHAGSINILEGATSPAVGYLSTSDDLRIFAVSERSDDPEAPIDDGLVVPADSEVDDIHDLVGKRVAVNRAGRGEYLLLVALAEAGIPADQVERVYLNLDEAAPAFASGKVDAWWAIVRGYPEAVANGARTLVSSHEIEDDDVGILAATDEIAESNPEALEVFIEVLADLTAQSKENPEDFQNVFLSEGPTATSGDRLARDIRTTRFAVPHRAVTPDDVATIQTVADFFFDNGAISKPVEAEDAVVTLGDES